VLQIVVLGTIVIILQRWNLNEDDKSEKLITVIFITAQQNPPRLNKHLECIFGYFAKKAITQ